MDSLKPRSFILKRGYSICTRSLVDRGRRPAGRNGKTSNNSQCIQYKSLDRPLGRLRKFRLITVPFVDLQKAHESVDQELVRVRFLARGCKGRGYRQCHPSVCATTVFGLGCVWMTASFRTARHGKHVCCRRYLIYLFFITVLNVEFKRSSEDVAIPKTSYASRRGRLRPHWGVHYSSRAVGLR